MTVRRAAWWEDWGVRGLYFFNTINTHTLVTVLFAISLTLIVSTDLNGRLREILASFPHTHYPETVCVNGADADRIYINNLMYNEGLDALFVRLFILLISYGILALAYVLACERADFHPYFIPFGIAAVLVNTLASGFWLTLAWALLFAVVYVLFSQFFLLGLPNILVKRDGTIPLRMMANSLTTIAPTTTSFSMSVLFPFIVAGGTLTIDFSNAPSVIISTSILVIGMFIVRTLLKRHARPLPPIVLQKQPHRVRRIVMLNIDGMRLDVFRRPEYARFREWERQGVSFPHGLTTVYRALTNPAFASILTGVHPPVHGLLSNNYGSQIKVTGLPDIVPARIYGSMHIKHFSKPSWDVSVATLIGQSTDAADRALLAQLRDDVARDEHQLYIFDFSTVDHTGHIYGSENRAYADALFPAQELLWDFFNHLRTTGFFADGACVVMSDHGIAGIDHSYMLHPAERYVPFIVVGPGITAGRTVNLPASITDIAPTVCAMLGVPPTPGMIGRVLPLWD
ncbi:MAG TPA: alkaline phosphatase family protein [bacterium]|nr:alkaline phosphatase family protein [bacterium]